MKRAIKNHIGDVTAIVVLVVVAIVVSGYILSHERLRFPFIQSAPVHMYAELATGQAFTPGQGQSVRVSGVQIGLIGNITLRGGRAVIEMDIDPKYKHLIRTNATALARPRTGLQDMFLEVNPGSSAAPVAKPGFTIPVSNTLPQVNVDEILASLDTDTRAYLQLLVNGAGAGLEDNGGSELADVLKRFLPTHRSLAQLNQAVARRGSDLRSLVNSLQRLNTALAAEQGEIVRLVDSSSTVFRAFASEDQNISRSVADLPATLRQTTDTLAKVQVFATQLGPAAQNLLPAARAIPAANQALTALSIPSEPIVANQIRPFVIASRPLVRDLQPAAVDLARATPNLSSSFTVLNHLFNMLGFFPGGGQHGYLWWLAWLDHNARTLFSNQDAIGAVRPLFIQFTCGQLGGILSSGPFAAVGAFLNLTPAVTACKTLGLASDRAGASRSSGGAATASGSATTTASSTTTTGSLTRAPASSTTAAGSASATAPSSATSKTAAGSGPATALPSATASLTKPGGTR